MTRVVAALTDPTKTVVVNTAPSVRAALGEEFGMKPGTSATGKMAAAFSGFYIIGLRFDHVYETDFAADLTIMEEGTELIGRITKFLNGEEVALPLMTSCYPGWIHFIETQYPDFLDLPSTARSPRGRLRRSSR